MYYMYVNFLIQARRRILAAFAVYNLMTNECIVSFLHCLLNDMHRRILTLLCCNVVVLIEA